MARLASLAAAMTLALVACEADGPSSQSQDVVVDTESELAWEQYLANVAFAEGYEPRCVRDPSSTRPRVLVTGFGRFLDNTENATGRIVSQVVPGLTYPLTERPPSGQIDDPAPQTAVSSGIIEVPGPTGDPIEVEVCGMVLPVFWDLASVLVLDEVRAFEPDLVIMSGIAGSVQPIWLELGSVNAAVGLPDGSGILVPVDPGAPLITGLPEEDHARGLLLSWDTVRGAAEQAIVDRGAVVDDAGVPFGDVLTGVRFAGYPRGSNTYLCNNTTYVVNWVLDHPGETVRVLEPSHPRPGGPTGIDVTLDVDLSRAPRVFVHWPSSLAGSHLERAADVLRAMIGAQILAVEAPSRGDASRADL